MTAKTRPESTDKAAPAKKETSPTTVMLRASGLFVLVLLLLFGVLFIKQALHDRVRNNAADVAAGLRVKMCVWLGVSRGLDLAFLNAD